VTGDEHGAGELIGTRELFGAGRERRQRVGLTHPVKDEIRDADVGLLSAGRIAGRGVEDVDSHIALATESIGAEGPTRSIRNHWWASSVSSARVSGC
jgi:hypothetical protein